MDVKLTPAQLRKAASAHLTKSGDTSAVHRVEKGRFIMNPKFNGERLFAITRYALLRKRVASLRDGEQDPEEDEDQGEEEQEEEEEQQGNAL